MRKVFFYQLFCYSFIILNYISCDYKGHKGVSSNISESKRRNIFIGEYTINPNPYIINDTLKIEVSKVWVEKQWAYGKSDYETIIGKNEYQLIIMVKDNILKNYGSKWTIGIYGDRYLRSCGPHCLITDFTEMPKDIEEWKVQRGWKLDSLSEKTIIGTFRVVKK